MRTTLPVSLASFSVRDFSSFRPHWCECANYKKTLYKLDWKKSRVDWKIYLVTCIGRFPDTQIKQRIILSDVFTRAVSASSNLDFMPQTSMTVTFNSGDKTSEASITINADSKNEGPETFEVALTNPSVGTISTPKKAVVTINDVSTTSKSFKVVLNPKWSCSVWD